MIDLSNLCNNFLTISGNLNELKQFFLLIDQFLKEKIYQDQNQISSHFENWNNLFQHEIDHYDGLDIDYLDYNFNENITLYFSTDWTPPIEWLKQIALNVNLFFSMFYEESGCDFRGIFLVKNHFSFHHETIWFHDEEKEEDIRWKLLLNQISDQDQKTIKKETGFDIFSLLKSIS